MITDFRPKLPPNPRASSTASSNGNGLPLSASNLPSLKTREDEQRTEAGRVTVTRRSQLPLVQWFYNLSVGKKHTASLFISEMFSVLGLVGVSSFLIISGGRNQLLNQAKAELVINEIQYNIKIDQIQ